MQKFTRLFGTAVPLRKANIDTDVIIPAKRLVGYQRDELGTFAFEPLRFHAHGDEDPESVFNQPRYRDATILVTDENFGCGSSRESAVWALMAYGFRCIIAPSFGDIFENNAFQNGLLLVRLRKNQVDRIGAELDDAVSPVMTVDLGKEIVVTPAGMTLSFAINSEKREALLSGRDEIAMTLARDAEIGAYQACDRALRPWVYETAPARSTD